MSVLGGMLLAYRWFETRYLRPALYDDLITIVTTLREKPTLRIHLEYELFNGDTLTNNGTINNAGSFSLDDTLRAWERSYIEAALRLTRGNVSQAAKLLGINRTTLYSRMGPGEEK